jgi:glycosyltransferase involved in cell wall biosynthesis
MNIGFNAQLLSLTDTYRAAGVSSYIYHLLGGLSQVDGRSRYTVFTGSWARRPEARSLLALGDNFRLVPGRLPTHRPPVRLLWEQTAQAAQSWNLDVLHSPVNVVPLAARCRQVVTLHDLAFLMLPGSHLRSKSRYLTLMTRLSARRADRIITDSEFIRQSVLRLFNVPPERAIAVPLAAGEAFRWLGETPQGRREIEAFRQKKGLPERYFLYLGTLEPRKNLPQLLKAFAALRAEGMKASAVELPELIIAGAKGWLYDDIFALVKTLELERHVHFPGFLPREEVVWWMNAALGFVYLSAHEGFGLPPLEAMSCGVPVLVNDAPPLPEVVHDAGLRVDANDLGAVTAALRELAAFPDLRHDLRRRGLERAAQFSWRRTAEQTLAVYETAAQRK